MACIDAVVAYLLKMLFRDMLDKAAYEIESGDGFHNQFVIFMAVIVEGDHITVIMVNAGSGNDGSAKIAPDVFSNSLRVTLIGLCMDIEAVFMVSVDGGFDLLKRRTDLGFEFIKESGLESIPQEAVVEMILMAPTSTIADTALRDQAVDMGIPFEIPSKGVQDTDKAGSKAFG